MSSGEFANPDTVRARSALAVFRRYVTKFVNCHDFSVLPEIMQPDYTLDTAGHLIVGRDNDYRGAVARQMEQFPGLIFTLHELFVSGDSVAVRFTEHGASIAHDGARAAWPSIAIYDVKDGLLARCTIEQDYLSRRRQLAERVPVPVDPPAIAPWDETASMPSAEDEAVVRAWLGSGDWLTPGPVQIDDSRATGGFDRIIDDAPVSIDRIVSGNGKVAFHGVHAGPLAEDFARFAQCRPGRTVRLCLSGLVTVADGRVVGGNIIRDRLGLQRRLAKAGDG